MPRIKPKKFLAIKETWNSARIRHLISTFVKSKKHKKPHNNESSENTLSLSIPDLGSFICCDINSIHVMASTLVIPSNGPVSHSESILGTHTDPAI